MEYIFLQNVYLITIYQKTTHFVMLLSSNFVFIFCVSFGVDSCRVTYLSMSLRRIGIEKNRFKISNQSGDSKAETREDVNQIHGL